MRHSGLLGAGGSVHGTTRSSAERDSDEFSSYVGLGSDGIGYIATVQSSAAKAAEVTSELKSATDRDWEAFVGAASD